MEELIYIPDGSVVWGTNMRTNLERLKSGVESAADDADEALSGVPTAVSQALSNAGINGTDLAVSINKDTRAIQTAGVVDALVEDFKNRFRVTLPSLGSTTDIGPILQTLMDSNLCVIDLIPGQVYYIDSTLFRDTTNTRGTLQINCHMAPIIFGPNAGAKSSTYSGDAATRFPFFINTKRTALNKTTNTVTTTESNTGTGSFVATTGPGLIIKDFDLRGSSGGQNVRAFHLNNTTGKFMGGRISYLDGLGASTGYCDSIYVDARNTNPFTTTSSLFKKEGNGDNFVMIGNSDSRGLVCDQRYERGAVYLAPVGGGMKFVDSRAGVTLGAHIEADEHLRNRPALELTRSQHTFIGCELWAATSGQGFATVRIADGSANTDASSDYMFEATTVHGMYRIQTSNGSAVDERQASDVHIASFNQTSRIRARGFMHATHISTETQAWEIAPLITSDVPGIQAAIDGGGNLLAKGFWDLVYRYGAWRIMPPAPNEDFMSSAALTTAPSASVSQNNVVPGAIFGGTYDYYFASIDEFGNMSPRTVANQVVISSSTGVTIRLIVGTQRPGTRLIIWRGAPGQPRDRYIIFGCGNTRTFFFDTGTNINKRPWITTGIPDLPSSTTGSSVDSARINGRTLAYV